MSDIGEQFDLGITNIKKITYDNQLQSMIAFGKNLVTNVLPIQAKYPNLTGNTISSYSFGVYHNGNLIYYGKANVKDAIRNKLTKGEIFSGISYDGFFVKGYLATIETDRKYGSETAYQFLNQYRPNTRNFAMVVTTGTEYSAYLENVRHMNVLTGSIDYVESNFINSFKPIA